MMARVTSFSRTRASKILTFTMFYAVSFDSSWFGSDKLLTEYAFCIGFVAVQTCTLHVLKLYTILVSDMIPTLITLNKSQGP